MHRVVEGTATLGEVKPEDLFRTRHIARRSSISSINSTKKVTCVRCAKCVLAKE